MGWDAWAFFFFFETVFLLATWRGAEARMMLHRRVAADDGAGEGARAGVGRPRLFALPRLLLGLGAARCAAAALDCDSPTAARSPTSPLDLRPFAALGGSTLRSPRSPRSWDSRRVGLGGLVDDDDDLAEPATAARNNRLLGPQMRQPFNKLPQGLTKSFTTQPRDCGQAAAHPVLGNVGTAGGGGKPVLCSRSYGDVKSGPEVTVSGGASSHPADLGMLRASGSLPASIGGPRRYIGSVSATEVEQSEDYTCIIAHGPNPKTTRIYGGCILEPCTVRVSGGESMDAMEVKEGAESYWLVKCFDAGEEIVSSCGSCKKKLDGDDSCIYRGEKATCSGNCRDNEILTEENSIAVSSLSSASSSSSFNDDIFMAEMVVLTAPIDAHLP